MTLEKPMKSNLEKRVEDVRQIAKEQENIDVIDYVQGGMWNGSLTIWIEDHRELEDYKPLTTKIKRLKERFKEDDIDIEVSVSAHQERDNLDLYLTNPIYVKEGFDIKRDDMTLEKAIQKIFPLHPLVLAVYLEDNNVYVVVDEHNMDSYRSVVEAEKELEDLCSKREFHLSVYSDCDKNHRYCVPTDLAPVYSTQPNPEGSVTGLLISMVKDVPAIEALRAEQFSPGTWEVDLIAKDYSYDGFDALEAIEKKFERSFPGKILTIRLLGPENQTTQIGYGQEIYRREELD